MPFENPIVAGEELIRSGLKSRDYAASETGNGKGWRIGRDGSADFNNIQTRGEATGASATYDYISSSNLNYRGMELAALLDPLPRGIIAFGRKTQPEENWGAIGTAQIARGPLAVCSVIIRPKRHCVFRITGLEEGVSTLGRTMVARLHFTTDGTNPGPSSPVLPGGQCQMAYGKRNWSHWPVLEGHAWNPNIADFTIKVGLFIYAGEGDVDDSIFTWADNGAGWVFYCEDLGHHTPGGVAFNTPTTSTATKTKHDKTYWWTSVQSYREDGNKSTAKDNHIRGYQGDGDAVSNPGGNHLGCFFFDSAAIRSDLSGATILETYIYLDNMHTYLTSGVETRIGTHNGDPTPATHPPRSENRWRQSVARGGEFTTPNLGTALGDEFRDGFTRGITVGRGPVNDVNFYSYFDRCNVRIVYEK